MHDPFLSHPPNPEYWPASLWLDSHARPFLRLLFHFSILGRLMPAQSPCSTRSQASFSPQYLRKIHYGDGHCPFPLLLALAAVTARRI